MTTLTISRPIHPDLVTALRRAKLHILAHPDLYKQRFALEIAECGCLIVHTANQIEEFNREMVSPLFFLQSEFGDSRIIRLYHHRQWPKDLSGQHESSFYCLTSFDRAVIGACAIELFILTNGFDELLPS